MVFRQILSVVCYLGLVAVPFGVFLTTLALKRSHDILPLAIGIGLLTGGILAIEYNYWFLTTIARELRISPGEVRFYRTLMVLYPPMITVALFSLLMEMGQAHFRASCFTILVYVCGAFALAALRWRKLTNAELLCLRLGWIPALVIGIPVLIPILKSVGLIPDIR